MKQKSSGCSKSRTLMYTQQVDHCPYKTVDELYNAIAKMDKPPDEYAVILHDKDVDEKGNPVAPHFHVAMRFKNPRSPTSVAKELSDKPQYVELWHGNSGNAFSYLCHRTKQACMKHQYDPNEVKANFDYPSYLVKQADEIAKTGRKNDIKLLLDELYKGNITKRQVEDMLPGSEIAKYQKSINTVWETWLRHYVDDKNAKMKQLGLRRAVVWIYGEAGTGKTRFALECAKRMTEGATRTVDSFFKAGSSRDPMQDYAGERIVILDELRPFSFNYSDLMLMLDAYGEQINSGSRFHDKRLACDTLFITSPYHPLDFYDALVPAYQQKIDTYAQMRRRIQFVIEVQRGILYFYDDNNEPKYLCVTQCSSQHEVDENGVVQFPRSAKSAVDLLLEIIDRKPANQQTVNREQEAQGQDACPAETESARGNDIEGKRECG